MLYRQLGNSAWGHTYPRTQAVYKKQVPSYIDMGAVSWLYFLL